MVGYRLVSKNIHITTTLAREFHRKNQWNSDLRQEMRAGNVFDVKRCTLHKFETVNPCAPNL